MNEWITHNVAGDEGEDLIDREWLLTNGTGAYAMGSAAGINTRRYHGLLVAAAHPPVGRIVALNQMFEQLDIGESKPLEFSACAFADHSDRETFAPLGHTMLKRFSRGLHVQWVYEHRGITITRQLFLHWNQQAATLRYTFKGIKGQKQLRLAPMLTLRDFHGLSLQKHGTSFDIDAKGAVLTVRRDGTAATFACAGATFEPANNTDQWWYGVHYAIEAERGMDDAEDYFVPGAMTTCVADGDEVLLTIAHGEQAVEPIANTDQRAAHLAPMLERVDDRLLTIAADDFVVKRTIKGNELSTILAGYPWFADWGRDTFIALPGLLLCTGRFDEARDTLHAYALAIKDGLIPNRFDDYDDNAAHYNTLDASLWFVHSAMAYVKASGDEASWNEWLAEACLSIVEAYLKGDAGNNIRMAGDGLITAGAPDTQLTWMDAKCDGAVFTPRHGKAVEINALWYNALMGMSEALGSDYKRQKEHYKKLGGRIKRSFLKVFWDDELTYLRDHVWTDDEGNEIADRSMRPNQIFCGSLPHTPMPRTKLRSMLKAVKSRLLTPFGLRTLPEDDPHYHGRYTGGPFQRDEAYHQGTVWPWLIGPYAEAVLRIGQFDDAAKAEAKAAIAPLLEQMAGDGSYPTLGQLHEVHEADAPHRPVGTMAQAWSVAEVLRVSKLIEAGA